MAQGLGALGAGLTELPGHGRDPAIRAKLFEQVLVTERRLINHPDVVGRGLIVHAPTAVHEDELLVGH